MKEDEVLPIDHHFEVGESGIVELPDGSTVLYVRVKPGQEYVGLSRKKAVSK